MAYDEIKLDYERAAEMAHTFQRGAEQLQDTLLAMQSIANILEKHALLGRGGIAFADAIHTKLAPSLIKLTEKFKEMEGDIQAAIEAMREADEASRSQFQ